MSPSTNSLRHHMVHSEDSAQIQVSSSVQAHSKTSHLLPLWLRVKGCSQDSHEMRSWGTGTTDLRKCSTLILCGLLNKLKHTHSALLSNYLTEHKSFWQTTARLFTPHFAPACWLLKSSTIWPLLREIQMISSTHCHILLTWYWVMALLDLLWDQGSPSQPCIYCSFWLPTPLRPKQPASFFFPTSLPGRTL